MLLAETIAVEGVAIGGAVLVAIVGAIAGYATMRANVKRNTERHDNLEFKVIPGLEAANDKLKDDIFDLKERLAYSDGKEKGARRSSGDSVTKTWEHPRKR